MSTECDVDVLFVAARDVECTIEMAWPEGVNDSLQIRSCHAIS